MNYYPHHIRDYRGSTGHLSMLEHGAYRQLLDWYYLDELPIPNDIVWLSRKLCARTEEEKNAVKTALHDFFELTELGWIHDRCEREIAVYKSKATIAQANGRKGGRPKRRLEDEMEFNPALTQAEPTKTQPVILANPDLTYEKANQEPRTKNQDIKHNVIPSEVTLVPVQDIIELFNSAFPELPQVQKISEQRRKLVKQRWIQNPELQDLSKWERFFKYIRQSEFLMGKTPKPWNGLCFDWIMNASNFIKIYEGNYHGEQK